MSLSRFVARRLWSSPRRSFHDVVAFQAKAYERATFLVRAFYAVSLVTVVMQMGTWPDLLRVKAANPQWPAAWLGQGGLHRGIQLILAAHLATAVLVLALPQWRLARAAYCLALLEYMALINGFGKINHNFHAWLFVSAVLILLPNRRWQEPKRATDRHYFLTVLWSCQVVVLFTYTLTGLWKLGYAIHDLAGPRLSALQFSGFSYIVAKRLLDTNQDTIMGVFFVRNRYVGWALFNGTMYLEATSILIAFRPRLYRIWGIGLLFFHLGTQLAMGFTFTQNMLLVGLLLVCAPTAPDTVSLKDALLDLPGVHFVARRLSRRESRATGVVDRQPAPSTT